MKRWLVALAAALPAALAAQDPHADMPGMSPPKTPATLLSGTGSHRHPIATASPEAQKFFDQGMTMAYGFNHEEAYRSFAKAAELDSKAAMPHWGMAFVLGSNYNDPAPVDERLRKARAEVEQALALSAAGPENERAYVEALAIRYPADPSAADQAKVASDYAAAMKALSARYPDDLDAATFYAESLMNLTPWKLWTPAGDPGPNTLEIVAVLESVLKRNPDHPGANHFYIHATEASKSPERALPSAKRLETLVPAAGHLVHMPAHVYVRTGDYVAAEKSNTVAAEVDRAYIRETGAQGMYPVMYYNHNVHFESYAASMAGRYAAAKRSGDRLFDEVLPVVSMDQMLEGFLLQPAFVAVRFRKWDDVRKMPDPGPKLPLLRAGWLWARAMAAAAQGDAPARFDPARSLRHRARGDSRKEHGRSAEFRRGRPRGGGQRSRRPHRRSEGRLGGRDRELAKGRRGPGSSGLRRAARLVLPDAGIAGRGAPARRPGRGSGGGLPRGPRAASAQRPLALRSFEEPRSPEEERRRRLRPGAVRHGLEGRRYARPPRGFVGDPVRGRPVRLDAKR